MHRANGIMPVPGEKFITFRADKGEESVGEPLRDVTQLRACPRAGEDVQGRAAGGVP